MKKLELAGKKFNKVYVIEEILARRYGKVYWKCKCDCGNIFASPGSALVSGLTKSCGCYSHELMAGYKRKAPGEASFNNTWWSYQRSAKYRGLEFNLSREEFRTITQKKCHFCNKEPSQWNKKGNTFGFYVHNGIDRMDNNKGYTIDNCVPCCARCNRMKMDMTYDEFIEQMKAILKHLNQN
jgi:hypothetical protein